MSDNNNPNQIVAEFASLNGLGVVYNANGDYSSSEGKFILKPPAPAEGEPDIIWHITRMIVHMQGTSFVPDKYGKVLLTNGIQVIARNDEKILVDFTSVLPVVDMGDWAGHCYDLTILPIGGSGDHAVVRWTFLNSGQPLRLNGINARIEIILNDNFSDSAGGADLVEHFFKFDGYVVNSQY